MTEQKPKTLYITCILTLALTLACATLFSATYATAQETKAVANADEKVNIDFNDVDIKVFIKFMAELTGRNFVVDEKVKGKVTIISPKKVTQSEAMTVFESTLEVYGYALLEAGTVTKIIPATEARHRGPFTKGPKQPGDRMVTRLVPLEYIDATELVSTLRPLIPPTSFITAYGRTNTLIIADFESNMKKILSIISQLDSAGHEEIITVAQLEFAGAKELATRLEKVFGKAGQQIQGRPNPGSAQRRQGGRRPGLSGTGRNAQAQIIPDERINSIIIVASQVQTQEILSLIEQLDVESPPGRGKINVYYLKNADAGKLAKVLNNITGSQKKQSRRRKNRQAKAAVQLRSEVHVTPDKATNSLVITASIEDYEILKSVIEKLDKKRHQVFVEALIMEVTSDVTREFGIEWRTTSDFTSDGLKAIGGVSSGTINAVAQNPLNTASGLTIGVVDGIINFAGKEFLNLGALLHALQAETGINILSTPNIMTTNNEEAEIIVAQNVPFVTGQSQNTGGTTLTTIERKNIGLTLRLTPQITESDDVRLSVYQEISSISPAQLEKAKDLITFTRSVKTTVIVHDKQNIVIGGLIRDDLNDVETKVPFLGDIPILGWLFKSTSKRKQKTNLLIFLRPHIIRNEDDIAAITEQRKQKMDLAPFKKHLEPATPKPEPPKEDISKSSNPFEDDEEKDFFL
ncbi:General secretion pathway protein D [hydrothermal vent metagenome]|uniref:General secretion pathway protein D n=1 Tax=hydrothermal vent metagenome TaxID=652676 RepID=A0A3B1CF50_9ZZZZ